MRDDLITNNIYIFKDMTPAERAAEIEKLAYTVKIAMSVLSEFSEGFEDITNHR